MKIYFFLMKKTLKFYHCEENKYFCYRYTVYIFIVFYI